jgi:TonB-dependent SusC/RagA subfamily outer membrane receptor
MPATQVERIEVIKGPEAAIYGSRGANGVVAIYTKRGKFMVRGMIEFTMQGYSTPKEYYVPKYPYREDDPFIDDRRTLLWVPYLEPDTNGSFETSFYTSDIKGYYILSVEGISMKGIPGSGTTVLSIQ